MTVRDTSLIALEKIKEQLEPDEQAVFEILLEIGPTHDRRILEALNQKEQKTLKPRCEKRKWEINSVTGRRNSLITLGVVRDLGPHGGRWHGRKKTYHIWRVVGDSRLPAGWKPLPTEHRPIPKPPHESRKHLQQIRNKAGEPVLAGLRASEAGRTLAEYRRDGQRKTTAKTEQQLLFAT